jgi:hypothetical protein
VSGTPQLHPQAVSDTFQPEGRQLAGVTLLGRILPWPRNATQGRIGSDSGSDVKDGSDRFDEQRTVREQGQECRATSSRLSLGRLLLSTPLVRPLI